MGRRWLLALAQHVVAARRGAWRPIWPAAGLRDRSCRVLTRVVGVRPRPHGGRAGGGARDPRRRRRPTRAGKPGSDRCLG